MRISDWSSDVCSSDLIHAGYARINAELFSGLTLDLGVRYEDARQFVTPLGLDGRPTEAYATTKLDNDYWLPAATLRSEEHTSELQSLMRISYAVFCLKQKKNKNQNRNNYQP